MIEAVRKAFRRIDPAWRAGLLVFILARLFYSLWSFVLVSVVPLAVQNITLGGEPILTVFDLRQNSGYVFSRQVDGQVLTFRAAGRSTVTDLQNRDLWDINSGRAIAGKFTGESLSPADYHPSDIFPSQGVAASRSPLLAVWQRFDTNWYLKIASSGYSGEDGSTAFFPFYPLLIRLAGFLLGNDLLAALLISSLALLGALVLLRNLAAELTDPRTADRTLLYLMIFPTSFFFFAAYTEGLFLFLVLASWQSARRRLWWLAALAGVLAALTRLQGVLLILPLAYMWVTQKERRRWWQAVALLAIPTATLAFFLFTKTAMASDLQNLWHGIFLWPWQNIWAALTQIGSGTGSVIDVLNLAATVLFGFLCIPAWKRLPHEWFLYMLVMILVPIFRMNATQPLVSMSRYVIVLFPGFLLLGMWGKNPWVNRLIVYLGVLAALYFSAQFLSWGWVA